MSSPAQRKATRNYRNRLIQQGITRFEVQAPETDRALFRALARLLAGGGPEAQKTRLAIQRILSSEKPKTGGVRTPNRSSPRSSPIEEKTGFGDLFASPVKSRS